MLNNAHTKFTEILTAIGAYSGGGNSGGNTGGSNIDVYFTNVNNWSTVNVYMWNASGNNANWPGVAMSYVETNSIGQKIYKTTVERNKYTNIIFNNGSSQTVDLTLSNIDNEGFYTTSQSGGKYLCDTYIYGQ